MRAPLSWLAAHVAIPAGLSANDLAQQLTARAVKVEHVERVGEGIEGVVVARVEAIEELTGFKKPIRWVTLDDGVSTRQVICGATNFAVADRVAYARPPALLPGGMRIERRPAYGRDSDGMICSARELGLGDDHSGILVLEPRTPLGIDVVEALGLADTVLDVAVNPDRGYALSIRGLAREIGLVLGVDFRDPADVPTPATGAAAWPVVIDDPSGCDRYVARAVEGLDPAAASPPWLQRRLALAGMRAISLAVDVTNHVMLELGQPLHAFDRGRLRGDIVVRRAAAGERLRTLDGADRALHPDDLLITDDSGAIAIAGVMGGASTEISGSTDGIVLESAHFDPVSIAYTARRHRLFSEASRRYERGVDEALAPAAAEVAVRLLTSLGGARSGGVTDVDRRRPRQVITLDPRLPGRVAGRDYPDDVVRRWLTGVGCAIDGDAAAPWQVTPPSWRPDLRRPVDLVEEVVRLAGYDQLPATVPSAPAGRGLSPAQRRRRAVSRALAAAGHVEVWGYPFVSAAIAEELMLPAGDPRLPTVRVANPVSEETPYLRPTLLPGLLATLGRNVGRGFGDVALYEIGPVFRDGGQLPSAPRLPVEARPTAEQLAALEASLPYQPTHVGVVLAGQWERPGWWGPGRPAGWADAVESARTAARAAGVELEVSADQHAPWHPGRCAALRVGGRLVGHAGELHPRVVEALGLPRRTCAAELRLELLDEAADAAAPTAGSFSAFPPVFLDVAVVVADAVPAAAVQEALTDGAGPLLEELRLFDVYRGDQLAAGEVSLAFRLRLRAADRTLTVDEATAVRDAAVAAAAERVRARLRG